MAGFLRVLLSRRPGLVSKANVATQQRATYISSKPAKHHVSVAVSILPTWSVLYLIIIIISLNMT